MAFISPTVLGLFKIVTMALKTKHTQKNSHLFIKHEWDLGNNSTIINLKMFFSYPVLCHRTQNQKYK